MEDTKMKKQIVINTANSTIEACKTLLRGETKQGNKLDEQDIAMFLRAMIRDLECLVANAKEL
jgi:hypothetical protein